MPEVIVIGGTWATREAHSYYAKLLNSIPSEIPAEDRYFPLPHKGLGHVEETYEELRGQIDEFVTSIGDDLPIVVGHSQGGVHAALLGLNGLASAVVSLAAPHRGIRSLRTIEDLSPAAADLDSRSWFIDNHLDALILDWPADIPFHTVSATVDQIVGHQFSVLSSTRWWDAPKWVPRCCLQIPQDVRRLRSALPSDHILLPWSSGVRWLVSSLATDTEMMMAS